ncbi:glycosyltransferase [Planococcus sp. ISL-109]|uniref:MGDG synthase family glycosyltransferase n=1 Tax=Planococcus sp. ISL-109 TaxID=2819166 RepID=UPI001BE8095C|nr:glycosyltransferase [Planococcus sp. ISL-109]MBT2582885.1 galactosyldiacylglycerol synthase [Planococcus sp. ISL-109]
MKKVLVFPLLKSMPSGHHQVADAICESIYANSGDIECEKLDILSEWNRMVEGGIVKAYLQWIRHFPETYAWTYRKFAYRSKGERPHKAYEALFMKKVQEILAIEKPDLIICTHGFPSFFINRLKETGSCDIPALNIYTDFFINDIWGCSHIDYHFVPSQAIKNELSSKYSIDLSNIFISGIPISRQFESARKADKEIATPPFRILMSGGSIGLGNMSQMLDSGQEKLDCRVKVLCGANEELYDDVMQLEGDFAEAYPYISSKKEMNELYEWADAIISKPGGVTVSEALRKQIPIFLSGALPGQEQINLRLLNDMGLAFIVPEGADALEFTCRVLGDKEKIQRYQSAESRYVDGLELKNSDELYRAIATMLERG